MSTFTMFTVCIWAVHAAVVGQFSANDLLKFISDLLSDLIHPTSMSWGVLTVCLLSTFEVAEVFVALYYNCCHVPRRRLRPVKTVWLPQISQLDSGSIYEPGYSLAPRICGPCCHTIQKPTPQVTSLVPGFRSQKAD